MAYSNDKNQIRAGFTNYIGALITASPYKGVAAKQDTCAILIEEALNIAKDEEGILDAYILKPMIRGFIFFLEQRNVELNTLPKNENIKIRIDEYTKTIKVLKELLSRIN